ncbi:beta-lactamase-like protein [Mycena belliarum]|uniref:Beta-lactamase-like protein n=1 Tax=Mycena belliarum TaxID=1033014 RepID=A0AAD6U4V8_9AGAR|nr:beta-lactamase-like protein [Mycena belliae]
MSFQDLGIPTSPSTVTVTAFDVVDPGKIIVPASVFFSPILAGLEKLRCPAFSFLIENAATKRRVMFDLGPRKDPENAAPSVAEAIKSGVFVMPVSRDIVERLSDAGVDPESISAVIWSHSHYDHTGDVSKFPSSTELVFGGDMVRATWETDPNSTLLESDLKGRKLVGIAFADSQLEIGGFKAHDFFGDGSFYLLDVPGHLPGHISALARVTPTTFLLLGGDACHHAGMLRPTERLHRHFPCPGELVAATRRSVSAKDFPVPGSEPSAGEFDLLAHTQPLLSVADNGAYHDPPTARASIQKLTRFDANADVLVLVAHDESAVSLIKPLPASLDQWKEKGWKELLTWAFLDEKNTAFRFAPKAST